MKIKFAEVVLVPFGDIPLGGVYRDSRGNYYIKSVSIGVNLAHGYRDVDITREEKVTYFPDAAVELGPPGLPRLEGK